MASFKFGEVRRSLRRKGFVESSDKHHVYLHHYHEGKATGPYTYVSHGKDSDSVGQNVVKAMKLQLKLESHEDVVDLVKCPMTKEQYVGHLKAANVIRSPAKVIPITDAKGKPRRRK